MKITKITKIIGCQSKKRVAESYRILKIKTVLNVDRDIDAVARINAMR